MTNRTINLDDLEALLNADGWTHTQHHEEIEREPRFDISGEEIPAAWGIAWVESERDGVKISYQETYNFDLYDEDSLTTGTDGQPFVWTIEGATLVDEDGDEVNAEDIGDYAPDAFRDIDYDDLITIGETEDIDTDEVSNMDTIELPRDNAPDVRFSGEEIASASSFRAYDNDQRWTDLTLYRTTGGKLICHQVGETRWQGERVRHTVHICDTETELMDSVGYGWLAKDLYDEAGFDAVTEIE